MKTCIVCEGPTLHQEVTGINDRFAAARTALLARMRAAGIDEAESARLVLEFESAALGWRESKEPAPGWTYYRKKVNKLQGDLTKLGIEMARENGLLRELAWKRLKEIERLILERQA